ncbi:hypothetical protein LIER_03875 [Lithospermum erythrorhizon]|uniref:Uncharacterized protein n=1 Tax=Lithospermum erythrorhizon TaxID=34254 RepID=A0AAV3NZE4_LITER
MDTPPTSVGQHGAFSSTPPATGSITIGSMNVPFTSDVMNLGSMFVPMVGTQIVVPQNTRDYLSRYYILSYLSDDLFCVYHTLNTAKAVWDALEYKYKTQDVGPKKFIVVRFLDFKMVDGKSLCNQVQELEVMFHEIHVKGMMLTESFQAAAIIEKLPPSWKDFKN